MNLEQLKEQFARGNYVCYAQDKSNLLWNNLREPKFNSNNSLIYKLIHKKHADIAGAIAENPDIEVESRLGVWKFKKDTDDFFRTYFEDRDYRIKPKQDTGEDDGLSNGTNDSRGSMGVCMDAQRISNG